LDSTNIISPEVSVITNIGLDHTNLLGDTLEKIAAEKAGIIKTGIPVVIGITQEVTTSIFKNFAEQKGSRIYFSDKEYSVGYAMLGLDGKQIVSIEKNGEQVYPDLKLDLKGLYQLKNLPAVLKSIDILNEKGWQITEQNIYDGLLTVSKNTGLLGRWQTVGNNPQIICDTGHNEDGIKAIVKQINNMAFKKLHFIFGTVADKNPEPILKLLPQKATYYFTRANIERAMNERVLMEMAMKFGLKGDCYSSVSDALRNAKLSADKQDLIFVGGSTFVVAEVL
ncbi:MAG: bifunctional folylpolyglutamate synthase/dihydrofolate synthase, partial [Draconibacterium sp.]|nr:bifunctional folylpolyglutamate synthase/dihydrofolate synthase [Draconibacterium sp.]